jgi:Zn-finger nucleic acid-binding protein
MSAYRTADFNCPKCKTPTSSAECGQCGGVWLSEASLRQRLEGVVVDNTRVPDPDSFEKTNEKKYECPQCQTPLDVIRFGEIVLERCANAHGMWFDADELQAVLLQASEGMKVDGSGAADVKPGATDLLRWWVTPWWVRMLGTNDPFPYL